MKFNMGKSVLRVHGALLFVCVTVIMLGAFENLVSSLLALLLHESGHILAAKWQKQKIEEIEITPYGAVMTLANLEGASPLSSFITALAGPVFSLGGCFLAAKLTQCGMVSFYFARMFAKHNLLLLLINLVPALPMDGGRMLRAILSKYMSPSRAGRYLIRIGYVFSSFLIMLSIYYGFRGKLVFAPAFAGIYLIYAASMEERQSLSRYITSLIARRKCLDENSYLEIKEIAARGNLPVLQLLPALHTGKVNMIYVLSNDGIETEGVIQEKELLEYLMRQQNPTIHDIIKNRQN